jgi:hypothetical protein
MKIKIEYLEKLTEDKRMFDVMDLLNAIKRTVKFVSWGARYCNYFDKGLLLFVNGHHFTGGVLITLAGNDTFTIYYIKERQVVDQVSNIYIEDLITTIDLKVEYIEEYKF